MNTDDAKWWSGRFEEAAQRARVRRERRKALRVALKSARAIGLRHRQAERAARLLADKMGER